MTTPRPPIPTAPRSGVKVASLVSAFLADKKLHVARYIKTGALGYCGITNNETDGIYYVPNWAFDGRPEHGDVAVCLMCSMAMNALAEPP
jgi:hypothetical protein